MRVPPPKPLTPIQLRGMSTQPESANVVVFMSALLLAQWLEGRSFADPDIKHTRVVTLEAVVPVGSITIEGTVMPLVDLTFKETVHDVSPRTPDHPAGTPERMD